MDPLKALQQFTDDLEDRQKYIMQNRRSLLFIHSMICTGVGVCIGFYGLPMTFEMLDLQSSVKFILSVTPLVGGLSLLVGILGPKVTLLEGVGLTLCLMWDSWMTVLFSRGYFIIDSNPYPILVYGGLTAMLLIHLRTFWKYVDRD